VLPLQLPDGEAPDVDVEPVQARLGAIVGELNLELHLVLGDRLFADGTDSADAGATPRAIRASGGELALLDGFSSFLAEDRFVGYVRILRGPPPGRLVDIGLSPSVGGPSQRHRKAGRVNPD
jgi:hypothetical protein